MLPVRTLLLAFVLVLSGPFLPAAHSMTSGQSVTVPSDGSVVTLAVSVGTWDVLASGTYSYAFDAGSYADAAYSWNPTYGACYDWPGDNHDLLVNGVSPWASVCDAVGHAYRTRFVCDSLYGCTLTFRILDDHYPDNSGGLTVTVTPTTPALVVPGGALVPADGTTVLAMVTAGTYTLRASGTYEYALDAGSYADADYSWNPTYGACYDWPGDNHDLLVNGASPWTSACDALTHVNTAPYACATSTCILALHIEDDHYADNAGHLTLTWG